MFRPAARFLIGPRPPDFFEARFLAAVILPPLLFFAILKFLLDFFSPTANALVRRIVPGRAGGFDSHSRKYKISVTSHPQSAEQVQNQQDDQDYPDNPNASARPPSPISVIASAAAKQEHQNNNQ
jgi:hypothetical protein